MNEDIGIVKLKAGTPEQTIKEAKK